jgi:hypothetical protein
LGEKSFSELFGKKEENFNFRVDEHSVKNNKIAREG